MLSSLIAHTIENGAITTVWATINLIVYFVLADTLYNIMWCVLSWRSSLRGLSLISISPFP